MDGEPLSSFHGLASGKWKSASGDREDNVGNIINIMLTLMYENIIKNQRRQFTTLKNSVIVYFKIEAVYYM